MLRDVAGEGDDAVVYHVAACVKYVCHSCIMGNVSPLAFICSFSFFSSLHFIARTTLKSLKNTFPVLGGNL